MYFTPRHYPFAPLPGDTFEVIVAGGGPVGLAAAIGLARRGIRVAVLEDDDSACLGSRAICISRHSLEVLDRLGVGATLAARALPWTSGRSYYRDVEVLRFEMPHADGDPHPPMVNISQSRAEQVLIDAALGTPGLTIGWRHRVTEVLPDDEGVSLTVRTPEGYRDLRADWLVAADGGRSTVRDWLGVQLQGTSYTGHYLTADIHWATDLPTERRVWFDPPVSPGQTALMHRQPDDIWRFDVQLPLGVDPLAELAPERVEALVKQHMDWLGHTEPWTLEWATVYTARALSLDNYHLGRVVFAGDAAHLVPIFGVRGLNSGFEDADMLSWTLALVVRGRASEALLDAYARERRAAWEQNIVSADLSTLFMSPPADGHRTARDAVLALAAHHPELAELINPRQSSATNARTSPLRVFAPGTAGASAASGGSGAAGRSGAAGGSDGTDGSDESGVSDDSSGGPVTAGGRLQPGDPVPDVPLKPAADGAAGQSWGLHAERGADFTLLVFADGDGADELAGATAKLEEFAVALRSLLAPAVGVRVLADNEGELAGPLGGLPGEVFVIRPDGLLLGRFADVAALGDAGALAGRVLGGGTDSVSIPDGASSPDGSITGGANSPDAASLPAASSPADAPVPDAAGTLSTDERMWRTLSDALDAVPADDREAFLTRLALLLALRVADASTFEALVAEARDSTAPPRLR